MLERASDNFQVYGLSNCRIDLSLNERTKSAGGRDWRGRMGSKHEDSEMPPGNPSRDVE